MSFMLQQWSTRPVRQPDTLDGLFATVCVISFPVFIRADVEKLCEWSQLDFDIKEVRVEGRRDEESVKRTRA